MAASVVIEHLKGQGGTPAIVSSVRFRSDDNDERNQLAAVIVPRDVSTVLSQPLNPSTEVQVADVGLSSFFAPDDYVLVDGGSNQQEVVQITEIPNSGVLSAIFRKKHNYGAIFQKVSASYSKVFQVRIDQRPEISLSNLRFRRGTPLPPGVFDQFRLPGAYERASGLPWTSSGVNFYDSVPVSGVQVALGPWTAPSVLALVELQWLFTSEATAFPETEYEFVWDEA